MTKKNHVQVKDLIHINYGLSVMQLIDVLLPYVEKDPHASLEIEYGYDGDHDYYVVWQRPMTEEELAKAEAKRTRDRENARKSQLKQAEQDQKTLEKLAAKLGKKVVDE